jgi:hypothetical protein
VQAEAGEAVGVARVRPGQERHPGSAHGLHQLAGLAVHQFLVGDRFRRELLGTALRVQDGAEVDRHVLEPRVPGELVVVERGQGAQHRQGRHLPGAIPGEAGEEGPRLLLAVAVEGLDRRAAQQPADERVLHLGQGLHLLLAEFLLVGGAGQRDAVEVLHALHAEVGGLGGADRLGDVAGDGEALLVCLGHDGQEGRAGQLGVDLDEVGPALLEGLDRLPPFVRVGGDDSAGPERPGPVHQGAGRHDARAQHAAVPDLLPHQEDPVREKGVHLADAGDPVGHEQRQVRRHRDVDVHVPQAGDEELAGAVHGPGALGDRNPVGLAQGADAAAGDDDGRVGPGRAAGRVDHGDVRDDQGLRGGLRPGANGTEADQERQQGQRPGQTHHGGLPEGSQHLTEDCMPRPVSNNATLSR